MDVLAVTTLFRGSSLVPGEELELYPNIKTLKEAGK